MPEILQFGPFMIKLDWVLIGISGMAGYFVIKRINKGSTFGELPVLDRLMNSFMIVFFVWKFSPLLFSPSILWTNPLSLITTAGSFAGLWIGVMVATLYMIISLRRLKIPVLFLADLLALGFVTTILVYNMLGWQYGSATSLPWGISIEDPLFKYHPINVYLLVIAAPVFIQLWKQRSKIGSGSMLVSLLTYFGMGLMLISFFKPKITMLLGLSSQQIMYLLMMISGFIITMILSRFKHHEQKIIRERGEELYDADRVLSDEASDRI